MVRLTKREWTKPCNIYSQSTHGRNIKKCATLHTLNKHMFELYNNVGEHMVRLTKREWTKPCNIYSQSTHKRNIKKCATLHTLNKHMFEL